MPRVVSPRSLLAASRNVSRASVLALALTLAAFAGGFGLAAAPPSQARDANPRTLVYSFYATDGLTTLPDGSTVPLIGLVGGLVGEPLSYLDRQGQLQTIESGPPFPTAGPITDSERVFLGNAQLPGPLIRATTDDVIEIRLKNLGVTDSRLSNDAESLTIPWLEGSSSSTADPPRPAIPAKADSSDARKRRRLLAPA